MNLKGDIKNIQGLLNASSIVGDEDLDLVIDKLSVSDISPDQLTADEIAFNESNENEDEENKCKDDGSSDDIEGSIEELSGYVSDSSVKLYLKDVSYAVKKYGLLSKEEEDNLAKRIKDGDEEAKKILISANLRLVISAAKKFANKGVAMEDLIQEGNLGLCIAAGKYDLKKGFRFSTYATWWILQRIRKLIVMKYNVINVPPHVYYKSKAIQKARASFIEKNDREPTVQEISEITGFPIKTIKNVMNMPQKTIDIDAKINDSGQTTFGDIIPDKEEKDLHTVAENDIMCEQLREKISELKKREQIVLKKYFFEGKSLAQIGIEMDYSRERVRQIKEDAIRNLNASGMDSIKEYLD